MRPSESHLEIDTDEAGFFEYAVARGWTDGLPVIAPTRERVIRMLQGTHLDPGHLLGFVPPRLGELTVEQAAVSAVMAGCEALHLPVVITAAHAMLDPGFNLGAVQATTSPVGPMLLVNGPIRKSAGIRSDQGCMGPGWRANMTIGRAIRLILINSGGASLGDIDKATHGSPGKLSFCFGENEEASPWPPLHKDMGYRSEDSVVHVYQARPPVNISDAASSTGAELLAVMAHTMRGIGANGMEVPRQVMLILSPSQAAIIARSGYTKPMIQQFIFQNSAVPASEFPPSRRNQLTVLRRAEFPEVLDGMLVPLVRKPEHILIAVAGGAGNHSMYIPSVSYGQMITRKIETD